MPLLLLHGAAVWFLTGLIWFVQIVHYPLFSAVGESAFVPYEALHQKRTTWVVGPVMLLELALAVALVAGEPGPVPSSQAWIALAMLGGIWISTAAVQVPLHHRLSRGFEPHVARRLVATNWIRTVLWTARAVLATYWLL